MMNVYLSAASSEAKRAAAIEQRIWDDAGDDLPSIRFNDRWWLDAASWTGRDGERAPDERRRISRGHFAAIEEASVFWMLAPSPGHYSCGCWVELGYAEGLSRALTIVVSGPRATESAFTSLSDRLFLSDDEALAYVLDLARRS